MLSYADRAKSRPRNYPTDPQLSTASTTTTSANSTAPSSVSGNMPNEDNHIEATPSMASASSNPAVPSAAQSNGEVAHEKTQPTKANPAPTPVRVNIWAQRAQARAQTSSANAKASSSPHLTGAAGTAGTESGHDPLNPGQSQISSKTAPNTLPVGSPAINEQEWPEVGPSSGTVPRLQHLRPHIEAEQASPPAKQNKTKWVSIAREELQEAADQQNRSNNKGNSRAYNRNRTQAQSQPGSKSQSSRNSPNRPNAQLSPVNALDRNLRPGKQNSQPHSQVSSVQNSPLRKPSILVDTKMNGIVDGARSLVLQDTGFLPPQSRKSSRHPSPRPQVAPINPPAPPLNQSHTSSQGNTYSYTYYSPYSSSHSPSHLPHFPNYQHPYPPPALQPSFQYNPSNQFPPPEFNPNHSLPLPPPAVMHYSPEHPGPSPPNIYTNIADGIRPYQPFTVQSPSPPIDLLSRPSLPQNSGPVTVNTNSVGTGVPKRKESGHFKFGTVSSSRSIPSPVGSSETPAFVVHSPSYNPPLHHVTANGKAFSIGLSNANTIDLTVDDGDQAMNVHGGEFSISKWVFGSIADQPDSPIPNAALSAVPLPVSSSQLPTPSTLDLAPDPNSEVSPFQPPLPPPAGGSVPSGSSPSWDQIPRPHHRQSPSTGSNLDGNHYKYGAHYTAESPTRPEAYAIPHPPAPQGLQPHLSPNQEYDPQYATPYYYPPYPPAPVSAPYYSNNARPYVEGEGRWRAEVPYSAYPDYESGFVRDRPPRGRGRRGRALSGRGYGRIFRGGGDRSRDFYQTQYRTETARPTNYRSPERRSHASPISPDQPFNHGDFGYYPFHPAPYPYPAPGYQPVPVPTSATGYPPDNTRPYLLTQVEYYFSVQNLAKDTHLRRQMDSEGWVSIQTIASFNRVRALTGGASPEYTVHLVKEVLLSSSLVEVDVGRDRVRLMGGKWRDFVLPMNAAAAAASQQPGKSSSTGNQGSIDHIGDQGDNEGEETDDDIEFVMGKGSPAKHEQPIPPFVNGS